MDPAKWGYSGWITLFSVACNYPEPIINNQKILYKNFFDLLQYTLPCSVCCGHYGTHCGIIEIDSYLNSRKSLIDWILHIHNRVNFSKKIPPLTLQTASKKYKINLTQPETFIFDETIYRNIWKFLFTITLVYPHNPKKLTQKHYKEFFESLSHVLPSKPIQSAYTNALKKTELNINNYLESPKNLSLWLLHIYNTLNPTEQFKSLDQVYLFFYNKTFLQMYEPEETYTYFGFTALAIAGITTLLFKIIK